MRKIKDLKDSTEIALIPKTLMKMKKSFFTVGLFFVFISIMIPRTQSQTLGFSVLNDSVFVGDTIRVLNTSSGFGSAVSFYWEVPASTGSYNDTSIASTYIHNNDSIRIPAWNSFIVPIALIAFDSTGNIDTLQTLVPVYPRQNAMNIAWVSTPCEMVINGSFEDFSSPPTWVGNSSFFTMIPDYMYGWIDQVNHHPVQTGTGGSYINPYTGFGLHPGSGFTSPLSPDCNINPIYSFGCCMPMCEYGEQYPKDNALNSDKSYAFITAEETNTYYDINARSYLIGLFNDQLIAGEQYEISFYANYADDAGRGFNDLGAYVDAYYSNWSTSPFVYGYKGYTIMKKNNLGIPQQITPHAMYAGILTNIYNWTPITGTITATGNENAIYIGGFGNISNPNYFSPVTTPSITNGYPTYAVYYIDHVSVKIIPRLTATLNQICLGDQTILEANNGFSTYQWYDGTSLIATTSVNQITVTPTITTTYTVVMTEGSCTITQTVVIEVSNMFIATCGNIDDCISDNFATISLGGNPTVQGGQPPYTYQWVQNLPIAGMSTIVSTTSNPSVTLQVPGTYYFSLMVTDAFGCYKSEDITINLTAANEPPVITGGHSACGSNIKTYSIANYDPSKVYTWAITSGTGNVLSQVGNSITIEWLSIPILPLFASVAITCENPDGSCLVTTEHNIYACCDIVGYTTVADRIYNSATTFTSQDKLVFNGVIQFNDDVTFNNCDIILGPMAKILVSSGGDFKAYYTTFSTCEYMSDGIYLEGQNSSIIFDHSSLSQSVNGINLKNRVSADINNSLFNNNLYAIQITDYWRVASNDPPVVFNGQIVENSFNTNASFHGLTHPYNNGSSVAAIRIEKVESIQIGDPDKTENLINNMSHAFLIRNSGVEIYNNTFTNIINYQGNLALNRFNQGTIVASYTFNNRDHTKVKKLIVGRYGNRSNVFNSCHTGVLVFGAKFEISGNEFNDCQTGIRVFDFTDHSRIDSNTFNNNQEAIALTKPVGGRRNIKIRENVMPYSNSLRTGINIINVNSSFGDIGLISNNTIRFLGTESTNRYGILMQNCNGIKAASNNIMRGGVTTVDIENDWDKMIGIKVAKSKGCQIVDNYLFSMGSSIYTNGECDLTQFVCNDFVLNKHGVFLGDLSYISDQGVLNTWNTMNRWYNATNINGFQKISTDPLGNNINWQGDKFWYYYPGYSSSYIPNSLNFPNRSIQATSSNSPHNYCSYSPGGGGISTGGGSGTSGSIVNTGTLNILEDENITPEIRDYLLNDIIEGIEYLNLLDEFRTYDADFLYQLLTADTSLIYLGGTSDSDYQNFFDSISQSSIGAFAEVINYIEKDSIEASIYLLDLLQPEEEVFVQLKSALAIYLKTWCKGIFTLTEDEYTTLFDIANQTPYEGGSGVYLARIMINYNPDDYDVAYRSSPKPSWHKETFITLYPSPAQNQIAFEFSDHEHSKIGSLTIYTIDGKKVIGQSFSSASEENLSVDVSKLSNSVYHYCLHYSDEEGTVFKANGKLVILR
ncbi:MAG TPA: hypothetical protein P5228_00055 [Bacteroidales bacterium]|nr:hypothetical protein [Bacteroidales bacterium]HRZ48824.1 hypothetical protein [Bacteroidales bacterium]